MAHNNEGGYGAHALRTYEKARGAYLDGVEVELSLLFELILKVYDL